MKNISPRLSPFLLAAGAAGLLASLSACSCENPESMNQPMGPTGAPVSPSETSVGSTAAEPVAMAAPASIPEDSKQMTHMSNKTDH